MSDRTKMIAWAVVVGACFAVGFPVLMTGGSPVVWGVCVLVSLPASYLTGHYNRRTPRK